MIYLGRWLALGFCLAFWGAVYVLLLGGCASTATRLVHFEADNVDVLFTTPARVDQLCKLSSNARFDGVYLGCYFPRERLAIVPHDAPDTLAHELRHVREGNFHP